MLNWYPKHDKTTQDWVDKAKTLCAEHVRPFVIEDDEKSFFRRSGFEALAKEGLHSLPLPKDLGGHGLSYHTHYAVMETIARASMSLGVVLGVTNLVQGALLAFGSDEQKKKYLAKLSTGGWIGAFSLSEPQSGSDAAALRCKATRVSGGYKIQGTKCWCSNAGHADLYLLMARTSDSGPKGITAFLVEKNTEGFRIGKQEKKLGLRASSLAELVFEDCFIPDANRIGNEGQGFTVALSQLDPGRITIGIAGVAAAMEALELGIGFASSENSYNGIDPFQGTYARLFAATQSVRTLVYASASPRDQGQTLTTIASCIKLLGSDLAMHATSQVMDSLGLDGLKPEFHIERLMRDSKALQIVEGTNQVQELVLSRELRKSLNVA